MDVQPGMLYSLRNSKIFFEGKVFAPALRTDLVMTTAYLAVGDGRVLEGRTRSPGRTNGELVFTTAYTGYEESLTDPSYEEQVLTFAYPLIGNYGVNPDRFESERVHPSGVVALELTDDVAEWLREEGVPAIDHLDTRDIVTEIRDRGAMPCGIAAGPNATPDAAREEVAACVHMSEHTDIGGQVSVDTPIRHEGGDACDVFLVDCGAKGSIIESLCQRDASVTQAPYDVDAGSVRDADPDVLFISNGPGDPENFDAAERTVSDLAGEVPIAGICLGQQIVANAMGGSTAKMDFGHRGVNQPVRDLRTDRVVMTTQNHGYMVDDPGELTVTQQNVNDGTPEGLDDDERDILTRQYHPEANPGPHDTLDFFDQVVRLGKGN